MATPPQLSPEERANALAKAKFSRQVRAGVKLRIKNQDLSIAQVLEIAHTDEAIAKMRVCELVESVPGMGKIRAKALLERLNISLTRRVQGLGRHQIQSLLREFDLPTGVAKGKLIVLSGPGGVGKSTVAKALKGSSPFFVSISATTRAPRFNEVEGVDYHFYTHEKFDHAISHGEFLEWAEFSGNLYGTKKEYIHMCFDKHASVILEIDTQGAIQIKEKFPNAVLIFIAPPSYQELESRLRSRNTETAEAILKRLKFVKFEMENSNKFDYKIINDELDSVIIELEKIINHERTL